MGYVLVFANEKVLRIDETGLYLHRGDESNPESNTGKNPLTQSRLHLLLELIRRAKLKERALTDGEAFKIIKAHSPRKKRAPGVRARKSEQKALTDAISDINKAMYKIAGDNLIQRTGWGCSLRGGVNRPQISFQDGMPTEQDESLELQRSKLDLEPRRKAFERQTHWDPRVRYFTGRVHVVDRIETWLSSDTSSGCPIVVTGSPGTGKSALLARVIVLEKANIWLHARGKTLAQATQILAHASGISLPGEEYVDDKSCAEWLVAEMEKLQRRLVIVVDAVDEARQPHQIAYFLLSALGRIAHVWLIVGTRPNTTAQKPAQRYRALGGNTIEIDLDEKSNIGTEDLSDYIDLRLRAVGESPAQTAYRKNKGLLSKATQYVAKHSQHNFLIARLTCDRLLSDRRDPVTAQPWKDVRDADVGKEFDEFLRRFNDLSGWTEQKARDLLEPLAYAQGEGFPWEGLWIPVANVLSGKNYTDSDIRNLLQEAAPYLIESIEDGRSVYRLFHEALSEHLRSTTQSAEKHRRITTALAESVPRRDDENLDWLSAHPYVKRYLAFHAAESGLLDNFVVEPEFLVAADPGGLKLVMSRCKSAVARRWANVYSLAAQDLGLDLGERVGYLELAASKLADPQLIERLNAIAIPREWFIGVSRWPRTTPHWTLEGYQSLVLSVAVGERQGRAVILSGGYDHTVRVWDMETLELVGTSLKGHQDAVSSVAVGERLGRAVILSGSYDDTIRVWDMETLEPVGTPLKGHQSAVSSVAVGERLGRAVVVSGSADATVRVWDTETLEPVGSSLVGHKWNIASVAVGERQGRAVIVSGGQDHTIRLWDMDTLEPVGSPLVGHQNRVASVAVGERLGRAVVVSGSADATVRVWDMETLEPVGSPLIGHSVNVSSVAVGERHGRAVILSGSDDPAVRVWDVNTLEPVGSPLLGHNFNISSVAVGERLGRAVIVSGSFDRTIRIWEMETLEPVGSPLEGHNFNSSSVAVGERQGRAVILTGGGDNTLRAWDMETLEPVGMPLQGHQNRVLSVAVGERQGRAVIVSGSEDHTIRVWDMETLEPVGSPLEGHLSWVRSVAVGERLGRAVILSGGYDHTVRVWDMETLEPVGLPLVAYRSLVCSVAVGERQGRAVILAGGGDHTIRVWDMETLEPVGTPLKGHQSAVSSVAVGERLGRAVIVSGGEDHTIRVWDMERLKPVGSPLEGHQGLIFSVTVGERHGRAVILSGGMDNTVRVWDMETFKQQLKMRLGAPCLGIIASNGLVIATRRALVTIHLTCK